MKEPYVKLLRALAHELEDGKATLIDFDWKRPAVDIPVPRGELPAKVPGPTATMTVRVSYK